MHQIDGICFLIFAERGLWNRFVPSLDGYIQDRLNNPVHVPRPRHDQGAAAGSAAAGPGAPASSRPGCGRRSRSCPTPPSCRRSSRSPTSRSSASPAPSRRCATCCSSSATCSTTWSTATADDGGRPGDAATPTGQAALPDEAAAVKSVMVRRDAAGEAVVARVAGRRHAVAASPRRRRRRRSPPVASCGTRRCRRPAQQAASPKAALTGATRELQAGLGDVPASLPRARRQGRPVAAAARRPRVDLRRAPDLRRA